MNPKDRIETAIKYVADNPHIEIDDDSIKHAVELTAQAVRDVIESVGELEKRIVNVWMDLSDHDSRFDEHRHRLDTVDERWAAVFGSNDWSKAAISELQTSQIDQLAQRIGDVKQHAIHNTGRVTDLGARVESLDNRIVKLAKRVKSLEVSEPKPRGVNDILAACQSSTVIPQPGQIWRHYKGAVYSIVGVARDTADQQLVVVYRDADGGENGGRLWTRDLEDFLRIVETKTLPPQSNPPNQPRFTFVK